LNRLEEIVAEKRREVDALRRSKGEESLSREAALAPPTRGFRSALVSGRPSVIAEVKRASPSRGVLLSEFDPAAIAADYVRGGADAVSVLTDRRFFAGSNDHLAAARDAIPVPVLRKDFIIDPLQILEARALGADAILLIVRLLDDTMLRTYHALASGCGMDVLVETHDEREVLRAVDAGASLIGVNNRDLSTFVVDLARSERLRPMIPAGVTTVSESGILLPEHAKRMVEAGFDAILVGEGVVKAPDKAMAVRRMKDHAGAGPLR
jgi:indole-3-glycerol phosphate synthase